MKPEFSITFVCHNGYGAISGNGSVFPGGGVEHQNSLMAKWLARRGHRVNVITWDEGQDEGDVGGVRLLKLCKRESGLRGARFIYPRMVSLFSALGRADSRLYYHNTGEHNTGLIALWCRLRNRKFVYSVASEFDCNPRLPQLKTGYEKWLYRYGLRRADRIIAQTERQREMLHSGFGLDSQVLPMPCGMMAGNQPEPLPGKIVGWVGRIVPVKRPEWLLKIAAALPEVEFWLVGGNRDDRYAKEFVEQAAQAPNLKILGHVTRAAMPDVYARMSVLCCTSECEGFPNTFLEAAANGVPIVSTFDPDQILQNHGMGIAADSIDGLVGGIRHVLGRRAAYEAMSSKALLYFRMNHEISAAMRKFEDMFHDTIYAGSAERR